MSVPVERMRQACRHNASVSIPISAYIPVAFLINARTEATAPAARAARSRHHRGRRRRAPVHALGGLPAARDPGARVRRAAARARRPRRASHGRRAGAGAPRRGAARARRDRGVRTRRGRRHGRGARPHRGLRVRGAAARPARDAAPWRATPRALRCELLELEPEEALPALALGDLDLVLGDEWQHQPRTSPTASTRHELLRDRVRLLLPPAIPPRAGTRTRCRWPSWQRTRGPPATPGSAGMR